MRADLQLIQDWIEPGSRVLDLGCGDGAFLAHLKRTRSSCASKPA
jgi:cyclopropane fatty-acyl-phospholipid synthase-like methyltransferase